jgi:hypothetical protein
LRKPSGVFYDILCEYFLQLGKGSPAFRDYLFRMRRNPMSIDIMTSAMNLPQSASFVSRPGILLNIFKMFGVHIMLLDESTTLCFMPNVNWSPRVSDVYKNLMLWLDKIEHLYETIK